MISEFVQAYCVLALFKGGKEHVPYFRCHLSLSNVVNSERIFRNSSIKKITIFSEHSELKMEK